MSARRPLVLRRQLEMRAELGLGLVGSEARRVGRDLEQDAAGLAEVDRLEVLPVDHGRDVETERGDALAPFALDRLGLGAERDVVDRARALPADGRGIRADQVHDEPRPPAGERKRRRSVPSVASRPASS